MLSTRDDIGHALTEEQEKALLQECLNSRCRQLYPAVMLALNTPTNGVRPIRRCWMGVLASSLGARRRLCDMSVREGWLLD